MSDYPNLKIDLSGSFQLSDLWSILSNMSDCGGSDMYLVGGEPPWVSIDKNMVSICDRRISVPEVEHILSQIYGEQAKSVLGSKKPIDGDYEFLVDAGSVSGRTRSKKYRFRYNAIRCTHRSRDSLVLTFRALPSIPPKAEELDIPNDILDIATRSNKGLIVVVGATGHGKSTLLASMIRHQLEDPKGSRRIVSFEHPVEFVYDAIASPTSLLTQHGVGKVVDSFASGAKAALRMAPDSILIGEARDYETISLATELSSTGHVVYSTIHASDVSMTIPRMVATYPGNLQNQAAFEILESTSMIIAQKLVPKVGGGRIALREYLVFNKSVRDKVREAKSLSSAIGELVVDSGKSFADDAKDKLGQGLISEETYRNALLNSE